VHLFAFHEEVVRGTPVRAVDSTAIHEISETAAVELMEPDHDDRHAVMIRVSGKGRTEIGPAERVRGNRASRPKPWSRL
jgi:hypothetical protein